MKLAADLPLPFPPVPQQVALLERVAGEGCVIASLGTDRFDAHQILADGGYLEAKYCPSAGKAHQFQLTRAGLEVLQ